MYFIIFVILLSIMGSSIAQTDVQRIESLQVIHSLIDSYVLKFSKIYKGTQSLKATEEYKKFFAQDEILTDTRKKMVNNEETPSVDTVVADWKTAAGDVIDKCIRDAKQYYKNKPITVSTDVIFDVKEATGKTMESINDAQNIIPQYKMAGCPIYQKLKGVNNAFGGNDAWFQKKYAPEPTQMPDSSLNEEAW